MKTFVVCCGIFLGFTGWVIASSTSDITLKLDTFTSLPSVGGHPLRLAIHDDGMKSIRVVFGYDPPVEFPKASGFDKDGSNETLIYTYKNARLYYVNTICASGECLVRLKTD
jgi:hypothetical protein